MGDLVRRRADGGERSEVGADQLGPYLLLVNAAGAVEQRPVRLGQQVGALRVIESGLAAEDQVVIGGLQRAIAGARVNAERGSIPPPAAAAPAR